MPIIDPDNIKLLCHMDVWPALDASRSHRAITTANEAPGVNTEVKHFGPASLDFRPLGQALNRGLRVSGADESFDVRAENFTLDFWSRLFPEQKRSPFDTLAVFFSRMAQSYWFFSAIYAAKGFELQYGNGQAMQRLYAATMPQIDYSVWHHFAVDRYNGVLKLFIDGNSIASQACTFDFNTDAADAYVGAFGPIRSFSCMDELRFIRGQSAYEGNNFTPATEPYPDPA